MTRAVLPSPGLPSTDVRPGSVMAARTDRRSLSRPIKCLAEPNPAFSPGPPRRGRIQVQGDIRLTEWRTFGMRVSHAVRTVGHGSDTKPALAGGAGLAPPGEVSSCLRRSMRGCEDGAGTARTRR